MGSVAERLDRVERKPLKCELPRTTESFARAGKLVESALDRAYPTREGAAGDYGVTPSLLKRQIDNADNQHLSFQRLWSMPDDFKVELLKALADDIKGVEVITEIRIRRTA